MIDDMAKRLFSDIQMIPTFGVICMNIQVVVYLDVLVFPTDNSSLTAYLYNLKSVRNYLLVV